MRKMKVLLTGGGTGGHIYPAIAIGEELRNNYNDIEILFVGTQKGLESELVPKAGFDFKTITVSSFKRKLSFDNITTLKNLFIGLNEAKRIIKEFKPDLVVGTGGYVCGPMVLMAALKNIKTVIHEQNVVPGVTNKILSRFVDKIFVSYEASKNHFPNQNKIVLTGNPVRGEFSNINTLECKRKMKVKEDSLTILSFGGSRGAEKINKTMIELVKTFNDIKDITLIHITGKSHYEHAIDSLRKSDIKLSSNIRILPYVHNMPTVMGASDLVISRAGAITLAEITTVGIPSILVPSPNVVNNHQEYNARVLEKHGAAIVLLEKDLNSKNLLELILKLKNDKSKLRQMANSSLELTMKMAADNILKSIMSLCP
jgi:UDP-N-acetylglucosamine--N-acetylmuramyl-(pentapeptide) pyrophosphoryl-undecaprenol N-acetylglucosamine transferase